MALLNYTPHTFVAGELVDNTLLNGQIRDPFTNLQAAWSTYTPTVTGSVSNPTLGTGAITTGSYHRWGKTVFGNFLIQPGTTGFAVGSGSWQISGPVSANMGSLSETTCGEAYFWDSSLSQLYVGRLRLQKPIGGGLGDDLAFVVLLSNTTQYYVGSNSPQPIGPSDQVQGAFFYEAAD